MCAWYHPRQTFLAERVPWGELVEPGVIRNDDRSLMRTYAMRGPDLTGLSHASQGALMQSLNRTFQRVPGHWSLHFEAQRIQVTTYQSPAWPHPVLTLMDQQRRRDILEGPTFETCYYLTIRRQPVTQVGQHVFSWVMTRPPTPRDARGIPREVSDFREQADHLAWLLRGVVSVCEPLTSRALLTYLHSTVSDRWHAVDVPVRPIDLNWRLCDTPLTGGWEPRLGSWHLSLCSVLSFPDTSMAPLLERLDHLPFGHRRSTRWIAWTRQASRGMFRRMEHVWLSQEKGPLSAALEQVGEQTRVIDSHATNQATDADAARQEVSGAYVGYGNFSTAVMVWGASVAEAETRIRAVQQIFEDEGFTVLVETEHSKPVFRSMIPGNIRDSVRRKPTSTFNVAHMGPGIKASWPGPIRDEHLKDVPWFVAHTEGSTLFRVVNHVMDVGHMCVLGPTGAGKSSALDWTMWNWYRYHGARATRLDIGGSGRALVLCLGGQYDDLTSGQVSFQPLGEIDRLDERRKALEWLMDCMLDGGMARTTVIESYLRVGVDRLSTVPASKRTLTELMAVLTQQSNQSEKGLNAVTAGSDSGIAQKYAMKWAVLDQQKQVKDAIANLAASGLLDGNHDGFREHWCHIIELGSLLDETRLARAVLPYVMRRIRRTFTGAPTLLQMDEFALHMTLPRSEEEAKRDLRSLRKANVSLMIATQSLVDIFTSALGPVILDSCKTRILLANPAAQEPETAEIYRRLGCRDAEITDIATMRAQGEYYLQQTYHNIPRRRRFSVMFKGIVLCCCGSSRPADHQLMDDLLRAGHAPGIEFATAFLTAKGYHREANQLRKEGGHATMDGVHPALHEPMGL